MAGSTECVMYGLDLEARCMCSVVADEENVKFLVGTHNIKMDNQVRFVLHGLSVGGAL